MLNPDQITIWNINLNISKPDLLSLERILSPDEKVRADRYRFDIHRHRFIAARANLRIILSRYIYLPPQQIKFTYSPKGKPSIVADQNLDQNLQFNLSHSEDLGVCAVTWNNPVGIDLESKSTNKSTDQVSNLAERFFSKEEANLIKLSSDPNTFLKIWTVKEAYLKATGEGLGKLSAVSTIWEKGEIIGLALNQTPLDWMIYQFSYAQDYIGAMVSSASKSVQFQTHRMESEIL